LTYHKLNNCKKELDYAYKLNIEDDKCCSPQLNNRSTACGTEVKDTEISTYFGEKILYFCEQECLDEFLIDPEKFIKSDHFLISMDVLPSWE
jgi:YHS domain-containing protein